MIQLMTYEYLTLQAPTLIYQLMLYIIVLPLKHIYIFNQNTYLYMHVCFIHTVMFAWHDFRLKNYPKHNT